MITVNNKKELENAIKTGHKEIYISDKKLQAACYLASKYQNTKSAMASISATIMSKIGTAAAIEGGAIVAITISICITAIAIIAIIKEYNVKIDYINGKIFISNIQIISA